MWRHIHESVFVSCLKYLYLNAKFGFDVLDSKFDTPQSSERKLIKKEQTFTKRRQLLSGL